MGQTKIAIPVDHFPAIHEIQTNPSDEPQPVTLLEPVEAVSEVSESEQEILATVTYMLNSGRVRLSRSFRDTSVSILCGSAADSGPDPGIRPAEAIHGMIWARRLLP